MLFYYPLIITSVANMIIKSLIQQYLKANYESAMISFYCEVTNSDVSAKAFVYLS